MQIKPLQFASKQRFGRTRGSSKRGKQVQWLHDAGLLVGIERKRKAIEAQDEVIRAQEAKRERRKRQMADPRWSPPLPQIKKIARRRTRGIQPWAPGLIQRDRPGACNTCGRERCPWDPNRIRRSA